MLTTVTATRYVVPLREGGSLPAIVEADDLGMYVVKFRGAGQGPRVLAAEIIAARIAAALGIRVPDVRLVDLPAPIARYEADEEAQDLLNASIGVNLGSDYLPGAAGFEAKNQIDADLAARILWLDGLITNIDRSWRNPNLLIWHGDLWCIDHGAGLYFHHSWERSVDPERFAATPYAWDDHVLSNEFSLSADQANAFAGLVTDDVLRAALDDVPNAWLLPNANGADPTGLRADYIAYLRARRDHGALTWTASRG